MSNTIGRAGTKWYFTVGRVLAFYICTVVVFIVFSAITKSISPKIADLVSIFLSAAFTLFLILVFIRWEKISLAEIGLTPSAKSWARFITGYAVGLLMAYTQVLIVLIPGHFELRQVNQITAAEICLHFSLYFLLACREELVFRSYFIRSLAYALNPLQALIIVTVFFIIEHILGGLSWPMALLGAGSGGILFGIAALKTKGLALPIGLHSAWNFGQWSFGFKTSPAFGRLLQKKVMKPAPSKRA